MFIQSVSHSCDSHSLTLYLTVQTQHNISSSRTDIWSQKGAL